MSVFLLIYVLPPLFDVEGELSFSFIVRLLLSYPLPMRCL